ncbi:Beta-galactosidase C-terminal domain, partial [Salana multivorans]|uniref:Beta-galactosidase C-terminal domain n=1 Tax=Salana multivorans TaxID=120377 RepID=UPI0024917067
LVEASGVEPVVAEVPDGAEVTRRTADDGRSWLFVLNHSDVEVRVPATGRELVTGVDAAGGLTVAAGAVAVVRETRA